MRGPQWNPRKGRKRKEKEEELLEYQVKADRQVSLALK